MDLAQKLECTQAWREFLLLDALPGRLQEAMPPFLKGVGQRFLDNVQTHPDAAKSAALDRWYASREGQETLAAFTNALWAQMAALSTYAMPAHDARHAMFKVPAHALEYMQAGNVQGWGRLGLLGALLHDYGRWAEERIWGHPGESVIHARLSFLLGKELLDCFDMPAAAKEQILLAAIRHTSGATPDDPMPLKLTVAADREQLYGPELVLRLFHHAPAADGSMSSFYGDLRGASVLDRCYDFLRTRLPGPLFTRQKEVDVLWWDLAIFILRCETAKASQARFCGDKPIVRPGFEWESAWELAQQRCMPRNCPHDIGVALLASPNVAPSPRFKKLALAKIACAPDESKPALATALGYARAALQSEDERQLSELQRIRTLEASDLLVQTLLTHLLAGWNG